MTSDKRKKLIEDMEHAYRSASPFPRGAMQDALAVAERVIRDDTIVEMANKFKNRAVKHALNRNFEASEACFQASLIIRKMKGE